MVLSLECGDPSFLYPRLWNPDSTFFDNTWVLVMQACAAYSGACFVYRYVPTSATSKDSRYLDYAQAAWNLGMCVFSSVAAVASWRVIRRNDCQVWMFLYCLSKPLEFMDTVWLMAKHKPILTLHWTHHVFTFLFTWQAAMRGATTDNHFYGVMMGVVNLSVHAIMYGYFFLAAFWPRVRKYRRWITYVQLSQFAFILVSMPFWDMSHTMRIMAVFMYGYYLTQFAKLLKKPRPLCEVCGLDETQTRCVICKQRACQRCRSEGKGVCIVCEALRK